MIDVTPKIESGGGGEQMMVDGFYVSMTLGFVAGFWSVFGSLVIN